MKPTIMLGGVLILIVIVVIFKEYQKNVTERAQAQSRFGLYDRIIKLKELNIQSEMEGSFTGKDFVSGLGSVAGIITTIFGGGAAGGAVFDAGQRMSQ